MKMPIGRFIILYCKKRNMSVSRLTDALNMSRESVYRFLRSDDMKLSQLRAISQFLDHNFFEDYYPSAQFPGDNPSSLVTKNRQLTEKIKRLESELLNYRDLIAVIKAKPA
jgi:hypothetical protein